MNTTSNGFKGRNTKRHHGRNKAKAPNGTAAESAQPAAESNLPLIRIILADSEAIFRVGMSKILAQWEDLEVVAQTETLAQTLTAVSTIPAEVILFELGLSPSPADAISEVAARAPEGTKLVVVTQRAGEQETVDFLRRGVRGILARSVSPELLVRCVRKVAVGETWLDKQAVNWVIEAYRTQALQGVAPQQQLRLSEKEMLIISGVTQGMKNKEIAREVGTTEQVVKNYLRKIYDKLHVVDRLELALYSMHHRLLEGHGVASTPEVEASDSAAATAVATADSTEPQGEQSSSEISPAPEVMAPPGNGHAVGLQGRKA
ncbi:MAG TPA: response regulator transcription factor [Terriglobales bacterium]|jgi:DNA-binding NarL/FixJ family response regulator|nr:response regulator transcription factor [Terriglobales bacterium]